MTTERRRTDLSIVTSTYPLSQAGEAVEQAANRVDGKVLVNV